MPRADKVAAVAEVRDDLASSAATLLTNYRGLSVGDLAELRTQLRGTNARYRVAKNTLTRIAARDAGMEDLTELIDGPTALVFCGDDPVGPAKVLRAFSRDHPELEFRGGYLDGAVLDAGEALRLADLASREELLAQLVGLMHGALANTARLLNALPTKQAQLVQALIDAGGAPGAPTAEASEAPAAEVSEEPAAEEPAAEEPVTESEEPDAESEEPAAESEEPAAGSDEAPADETTA